METILKSKNTLIISNTCRESYSCQHFVILNGGQTEVWYDVEIYLWCIKNKIEVPEHFQCYKNEILD